MMQAMLPPFMPVRPRCGDKPDQVRGRRDDWCRETEHLLMLRAGDGSPILGLDVVYVDRLWCQEHAAWAIRDGWRLVVNREVMR